jgi:hypothetical protein
MNFDHWWASLTEKEQRTIGINNAKFVWREACEVCAQIADVAEPYKCAELIRSVGRDSMPLFDDWDKKWQ